MAIAAALFISDTARAAGACQVVKIAELPVTMVDMQPLVSAKVNGSEVRFLADSGAFFSALSPGSAAELKLPLYPAPFGFFITGVGGDASISVATVKLTLANQELPHIDFMVGGSEVGASSVGLLGENVLGYADGDYDLANGVINLTKLKNCSGTAPIYWDKTKPFSAVQMTSEKRYKRLTPSPRAYAYLNGTRIRVMLDTGAGTSVLSLDAAARAGVKPGGPGVVSAGYNSGIGRRTVQTWVAPFDSFKIGDEEIKHTKLRIGKIGLDETDMLLGADFFLSHHVYVANSQNKIYFTYNGGPVFNLSAAPQASETPADAKAAAPTEGDNEPKDAEGYSRRGQARLQRRDLTGALSDLDQAIKLAPSEARYFQERGVAHMAAKQQFLAMSDFDQALKLKPDLVPALLERGQLRVRGHEEADALADFDAADRALAKEADLRLFLGLIYSQLHHEDRAIAQFDLWIKAHPDDSKQPQALNGRCWARAQLGKELPQALSDCNASLRQSKAANTYDSRGLVQLRLGAYDKAIADYDAALALQPKTAWSLYGRGVAKIKTGHAAEGQADIAAATAINAELPAEAKSIGVTP
jgi:tetratricopeptide (TPR) repeat protein